MESVVLLTKLIGILTPLVQSIVVCVALRLISYKKLRKGATRSYCTQEARRNRQIISYMGYGVRV